MPNSGFMIPLNWRDYAYPFERGTRDICDNANEQTYTKAPVCLQMGRVDNPDPANECQHQLILWLQSRDR
jgi:hypothetical protein